MGKVEKSKLLKAFVAKQSAEFTEFCRKHGICRRCRVAAKPLASETMCKDCAKYYKDYAKERREREAKATKIAKSITKGLPAKRVVKDKSPAKRAKKK